MQSQQQANFQQQQAAAATRNAQTQVRFERQQQMLRHQGEVRAYQAQQEAYSRQLFNNSTAANNVYVQEQLKFNEARNAAAFKSQEIYAKQVGAMGSVLASGRSGQSVGLLVMDAQRQGGFAEAQQSASIRSAELQRDTAMQTAQTQHQSANNEAASKLMAPPQAPQFAPWVTGIGGSSDPGVPSYNWG
jgi:hypothetical protein